MNWIEEQPFDTLIAFEGSTGDLFPYVHMAIVLREKGYNILFCCAADHT